MQGAGELMLHVLLLYLIPNHNIITIPPAFPLQGCKWLLMAAWNKTAFQRKTESCPDCPQSQTPKLHTLTLKNKANAVSAALHGDGAHWFENLVHYWTH